MMKKKAIQALIPLKKQSKKRQKAYHSAKRGSWGELSPVTRVVQSKKAYDRQKQRQADRQALFEREE
jgi:hypothetical protein